MNPLRLFSKTTSTTPKKLSFDVCDGLAPAQAGSSQSSFVVTTRGDRNPSDLIATAEPLSQEVESSQEEFFVFSPPHIDKVTRGARKHGRTAAHEPGCPEDASPIAVKSESSKVPTPGRGKKTSLTPGRGMQSSGSTHVKNSHHRRSLSNTPRSDNNPTTSMESSLAPATRTLRQSASFSGISTPRGGRPPTSGDLSTTPSGVAGATPRSAGKWPKYGVNAAANTRLPKALVQHEEESDRTERVEDPNFLVDHSVQVLIRARPISSAEMAQQGLARCVKLENAHTVSWLGQPETRFTFDHVAGELITQEELFRVAGLPMVENCMAGYNSCMFAYGQTGSGKTHTMLGDIGDFDHQPNKNCGMTPRVFDYLFAKIQKEEEAQKQRKLKYKCRCSFLEIYNEQISDLLEPSSANLQMREDLSKGVYVEGLLEVEVQNVQDVLHLLLLGATNRKVAATNMNKESSRSHSVFTCVIESQWECDSMINFRYGRLNLVDLAGSERQKATGEDGERLREAASINKSLSTLGLVIMVLVDIANGKQRHVPYRDSKLTFLLQDSLGGNSKTTIIANISPSSCAASETLSTLKFAQRAKFIQNNAVINEQSTGNVRELQEQIQQLKDELARIRRQSISRMPSLRVVEDENGTDVSFESGFDPLRSFTEGSFLQFGRAVLGPTALTQKIKELEDLLAGALEREKVLQKTSAAEILDLTRLVGRNTTIESAAIAQETLIAELASERRTTELLRFQVDSCQQEISEYRVKLQFSQECNEGMTSELDALCKELENSQEECRTQKQEIGILQGKIQQLDCLKVEQEQHEQFVIELKSQIQKSEERAQFEMKRQRQLEHQLRKELQESTDLHAELESTRVSPEEAEALVEILRERGSGLQIVDMEAPCESGMIKQLRNEITDLKRRLEKECDRRRELEKQVSNHTARGFTHELQQECNMNMERNGIRGRKRVRHHDAILQLQMKQESYGDGSHGRMDSVKGYRWKSGIVDNEAEVTGSMTTMQLRLNLEALEGVLPKVRQNSVEARSSSELLQKTSEKKEVEINAQDSRTEVLISHQYLQRVSNQLQESENEGTQLVKMQEALLVTREHFNVEIQTLVASLAGAEIGYVKVMKELESIHSQFQGLADRTRDVESRELVIQSERKKLEELKKYLEAVHIHSGDLPKQIEMELEGSLNVKEEIVRDLEDWVLDKSDLLSAVQDDEARCMENNDVIRNLKEKTATLSYGASGTLEVVGLRSLSRNGTIVMLEKNLENMAEAIDQITAENNQLQTDIELLRKDSDDSQRLMVQREEELAIAQKKLADAEDLMEQGISKIEAISLLITEAGSSESSWAAARQTLASMILGLQSHVGYSSAEAELELARTQILLAGSEGKVKLLSDMVARMQSSRSESFETELEFDLVKVADRPLRRLPDNRSRISSSDNKTNNPKLVEKLRQGLAKTKAENAKLISKVRDKEKETLSFQMQLSSAVAKCEELEFIAASKEKILCHQLDSLTAQLEIVKKESMKYKSLSQKSEDELERLTMLLLETEERQRQAEHAWIREKTELQSQRYEAQLEAATKKLKLPARFVKLDKWHQRLSEADQLINILVQANERLRQECSQRSTEADIMDKLVLELLETVALTRDELHTTMNHTEVEFRALNEDIRLLKADFKCDLMRLSETQHIVVEDMMRPIEMLPSSKCLQIERRPWELQCKAGNALVAEKESEIRSLQAEVAKAAKQMWSAQTEQMLAVEAAQANEETIRKNLNEVNHLQQSADWSMSLRQSITESGGYYTPLTQPIDLGPSTPLKQNAFRQSLTKEGEAGNTPLRRSFSCKLIEEKEMTLSVLKEEQEYLKTMVFSLDTEKSELQQQLVYLEASATALRSTIANLENKLHDSNRQRCKDVDALVEQLQESTRHICDLQVQRTELREEIQRQAVSFAELYEELQKQERKAEAEKANNNRADENKHVTQMLEQEKAELKTMVELLGTEIMAHQVESKQLKTRVGVLESDLALKTTETVRITEELTKLRGLVASSERDTKILGGLVEDLETSRSQLEEQLQCSLDASISKVEHLQAERDKLQDDLHLFMEQLEEIQALADQRDIAASDARQAAEINKTQAEEKQVEVEILGKSVEELENTVYALESQVGLLKRECERQRLMREEMESEIQGLKSQNSIMQSALHEASTRSGDELLETKMRRENAESKLEEREAELQLLHKKLEKFQMQFEERKPVEWVHAQLPAQFPIQRGHKLPKGATSAFACIKLNHQVHLELDEERKAYERRIQELEDVLGSRQSEVTTLHEKLADAERMTRDVLGVLRCIKLDMSNVATLLDEQQVEEGVKSDNQTLQKDEEIEQLLTQLNDFIEERESWMELISRKQLELLATQASVENLKEKERSLVADNKKLVTDSRNQLRKIGHLEQEVKTLSGQQNLQQRIKHHARIKEENNSLRIQNNELHARLRRIEHLNTRFGEELAKYRTAQGKPSALNIEEEQRLCTLLQETEQQRDLEAQKLATLSASVMNAAGMTDRGTDMDPTVALEAIKHVKHLLESTLLELEDFKLKTRISEERQRLNELRIAHSPLRGMDVQSVTPR